MKTFCHHWTLLVLLALVVAADTASACSLPVFRYALERWQPDPYMLVLYHKQPLTRDQQSLLNKLREYDAIESLIINTCDTTKSIPAEFKKNWDTVKPSSLPFLSLFHNKHPGQPLFSGPLDTASVKTLLDFKLRSQIVQQLTQGKTAVWLFFKSNDPEADKATRKKLQKLLKMAEKEVKLPHEVNANDTEYDTPMNDAIALSIAFSIIDVSRDTPEAKMILKALNILEPKRSKSKAAFAVPVFGQARALTILTSDEINEDNVFDICEFLAGPCSCVVKAQNPGIDLFIPIDWYGLVEGIIAMEDALPPLSVPDISAMSDSPKVAAVPPIESSTVDSAKARPSAPKPADNKLRANFIFLAIVGLLVLLSGTALIMKRTSKP